MTKKVDARAQELADAFLETWTESYTKSWPILHNGKETGEEVQVIVVKHRQKIKKAMILNDSTRIQFYGSGTVCGACGGSGRVG